MSVASPPPIPTRTVSRTAPAPVQPSLNRVQQVLSGPPPRYGRPLLMFLLAVGLLAASIWGAFSLAGGVEMRLLLQNNWTSQTDTLPTSMLGQSFYVTRPNLSRIDLQMSFVPVLEADGRVRLLEGEGLGGKVVYEVPLHQTRFTQGLYLTVDIPPQADSQGRTYTIVVDTPGRQLGDAVGVRYNTFDALTAGGMYTNESNGRPTEGDLSFVAYYRYDLGTLLDDLVQVTSEARRLVLSPLLLLLLPGLALLVWLPNSLSAGQRLLAAPGLTALALPVFFLVTRALGLKMGTVQMWLLLIVCAGFLAAGLWRLKPKLSLRGIKLEDAVFWSLLLGVLAATIISRFVSLRDQVGGIGIDAYHHTMISQLFVEQGGIPANYQPYAPLASFTYHYGFHSLAASVAWLSGRTSPGDMMLLMPQMGQIADTLPVLTLTLFAWKALGDRWAGLAAGALAGVFSIIPAFYVNWSRFTQGLGLALLPLAWILLMEVLDRAPLRRQTAANTSTPAPADGKQATSTSPAAPDNRDVTWQLALRQSGPYMLAVIGASGLALAHYRVAAIYAVFVALYVLWRIAKSIRQKASTGEVVVPARRVVTVAVLSAATLLPWVVNLRSNFAIKQVSRGCTPERASYYDIVERIGADILYHPSLYLLCALSLGGIGWAIKRRDLLPLLPAFTWLLVLLYSNPCLFPINVPGAGYLDLVTVVSGAWVPLCLMAGYPLARFARWAVSLLDATPGARQRAWRLASGGLIGAVVLLCGFASGMQLAPVVVKDNKPYLTPGDVNVLTWMRDNLPRSSYVLAEPFAFGWSHDVLGTDAGIWVPYVAGVPSSVPPMTAYNERPIDPDYIAKLTNLVTSGIEPLKRKDGKTGAPLPTTADWDALKQAGITHIYAGSRGEHFDTQFLFDNPDSVTPIYHHDNAWLFELR
ncbi:MAG: hypothetical protein M3437_21060 [Chloroflexota bacterium]|nr:hypothetical protein [Chloroflexota bacterium]MDQ5867080.1 hypothetical protein [Chloroflexota bacterium]